MTTLDKKLIYSKWENPLIAEEDSDYKDSYDRPDFKQTTPCVLVPQLGFFPVNTHNHIGKVFNFWNLDANFEITHNVADIISHTPGVEIFECITRYRARIGVGRAFRPCDVFNSINKRLNLVKNRKSADLADKITAPKKVVTTSQPTETEDEFSDE